MKLLRSHNNVLSVLSLFSVLLLLFVTSFNVVLVSAGTNAEGQAFLAENAKKPDVITLASGLQYRVLKEGSGQYHPVQDSQCLCHYHGTLIDGTTFDSSYDRNEPTTFAPNQVIKGWTEAMQLMVEGDVWELTIPSELAYGDSGSPPKIPGVPASKCNVVTKDKCTEQDIAYIDKVTTNQWSLEKMQKERERLETMSRSKVKDDLKAWIQRRIVMLRELSKPSNGDNKKEETKTEDDSSSSTEL